MTQPRRYQIRVEGRLSERWAHWFDDMNIRVHAGTGPATTTLTGTVADQAALLGLLQRLYNLGLPLLLVRREEDVGNGCVDGSDNLAYVQKNGKRDDNQRM